MNVKNIDKFSISAILTYNVLIVNTRFMKVVRNHCTVPLPFKLNEIPFVFNFVFVQ